MAVRAVRGATCLVADDADEMADAVTEMMMQILERNSLTEDDVINVIFTSTPDLNCAFPATAARTAGFDDVPLMCAREIPVPGALERTVRAMVLVESDLPRADIQHVFLRGAEVLRGDLSGK